VIGVDADLAGAVLPYLSAVAAAYGTAVLDKVRDEAVDATAEATVGAGRRMLRWILRRPQVAGPVADAVQKVADNPADTDRVAVLRVVLRDALAADPQLAANLAALVGQAPPILAAGPRSVAVRDNTGIVQTGDGSSAWQQR
jgi:hypothetical protein